MKRFALLLCTLAVSVVMLTGCGNSEYNNAMNLYEQGNYSEAREIFIKLGDYEDSSQMARKCMLEQYGTVIDLMTADVWFFNGGSDVLLNKLSFTKELATITQFKHDGNGKHHNSGKTFNYIIDDTDITLTNADGTMTVIPYKIENNELRLGMNEYFTPEEINAGLQGYWKERKSDVILGRSTESEHNVYINNGEIIYEYASKNYDGYYYYGPYEGTYSVDETGFSTNIRHGATFSFNIINGKPVLIRYDNILSPSGGGLPGGYGYSF